MHKSFWLTGCTSSLQAYHYYAALPGIQDYFEVILISEIEQVRKPQAEIFHRAAKRLGVTAKNSVFIGDHPEASNYKFGN